jgi:hypothetical protein
MKQKQTRLNRNDIMNLFLDVNLSKGLAIELNTSRRSLELQGMTFNSSKSLAGIANSGQEMGSIFKTM